MESWGIAVVVLAAVLVGAAIPALVQLREASSAAQAAFAAALKQSSGERAHADARHHW